MEVYKVVKLNTKYEPLVRGTYMSSRTTIYQFSIAEIDKIKSILFYSIGKVTKPHFGFIFCFENLQNSKSFVAEYDGIILLGKGNPSSKNSSIFFGRSDNRHQFLEDGWKNYLVPIKYEVSSLPEGTIFMRSFRPLRIVE